MTAEKTTTSAQPALSRDAGSPNGNGKPLPADSGRPIEFERMLDDKGRITIPPRIRRSLGTEYVTARGAEGSVLVVPTALWPAVEEWLNRRLPADDRYLQFAIHNRTNATLDRQGRLKLPKHLLEWASLEAGDAAAIIANGEKFEIWNKRALLTRPVEGNPAGSGEPGDAG